MEVDRQVELLVPHYYQLAMPEGTQHNRLPLLVGLHGYAGDMVSMMRLAKGVAEEDMIVASVQGPHQFLSPPLEEGNTEKTGFGWLRLLSSKSERSILPRTRPSRVHRDGENRGPFRLSLGAPFIS